MNGRILRKATTKKGRLSHSKQIDAKLQHCSVKFHQCTVVPLLPVKSYDFAFNNIDPRA